MMLNLHLILVVGLPTTQGQSYFQTLKFDNTQSAYVESSASGSSSVDFNDTEVSNTKTYADVFKMTGDEKGRVYLVI